MCKVHDLAGCDGIIPVQMHLLLPIDKVLKQDLLLDLRLGRGSVVSVL